MTVDRLEPWIDEYSPPDYLWYVKRLSANDTLATGGHQAGPYLPKGLLFKLFPSLHDEKTANPRVPIALSIDSHEDARTITAIWYNKKLSGGTRNETRLTGFGGSHSAMLDPESTGAIAVFAFEVAAGKGTGQCHVWICEVSTEEDLIEARVGIVEPGEYRLWSIDSASQQSLFVPTATRRVSCFLAANEIPPEWLTRFPSGEEIVRKTIELQPENGSSVDARLLSRRKCEYEVFRSLEEAVELPRIARGFHSLQEFIDTAQTILQRRKARSGRSLELHTRYILCEEGFKEDVDFSYLKESEPGKEPDFIFPSIDAYRDPGFPQGRLRMLAAKTTTKDRWRQILDEADRIQSKHLLTLQEGVSETQFQQMSDASVTLVVPQGLIDRYPKSVQPHLLTLESFIGDLRVQNPKT